MTNDTHTPATEQVKKLFEVGAHFGYSRSRRHPTMKDIIFGAKNTTELIDLEQTVTYLDEAKEFVAGLGKGGKQILFVGSKYEAKGPTKAAAESIGMPYVIERWIGGTLTNYSEIRRRVQHLATLQDEKARGEFAKYTKKEQLFLDRDIESLEISFGGISDLKAKPDAMFVVDPREEYIAVKEAQMVGVPVIALMNSDCDLTKVEYPIPANDSSGASIEYILSEIASAYKGAA